MDSSVKENQETLRIEFSSSSSSSSSDSDYTDDGSTSSNNKRNRNTSDDFMFVKKPKVNSVIPPGFLMPLRNPQQQASFSQNHNNNNNNSNNNNNNGAITSSLPLTEEEEVQSPLPLTVVFNNEVYRTTCNGNKEEDTVALPVLRGCRQFWKAGDYDDEANKPDRHSHSSVGMDHVRVHPKFLHSNATSHKWALGAFAELLDNSLDEARNGATYVHVDMLQNLKDGGIMLLVEDNGGGMNPDKMRQCMSLGYSAKSKQANTIGQYGNGFKTSTMRLGADVIVFSRCKGNDENSLTQSIGLLSYTFLTVTGKEDIVVPMIDFENRGQCWNKIIRSSLDDWNANLDIILQWSPFVSEEHLNQQFNGMKDQGTRVIIYNLWQDDDGNMELDFDADPYDIQIRGVNRDEKSIQMAETYPNSKHYLTYKHSLRSYAAILYQKLPSAFRIAIRGKDVEHHDIGDDMIHAEEAIYRPQSEIKFKTNVNAKLKFGFSKDAHHHIDIQGFSVYHRNRLIKPFWRVWNAAGSDGRGVIGRVEADFVKPAHDKQDFERTDVLHRLENRLIEIQKKYWSGNCQKIGYAPRRNVKDHNSNKSSKQSSPPIMEGKPCTRASKKLPADSAPANRRDLLRSKDTRSKKQVSVSEEDGTDSDTDTEIINTPKEKGSASKDRLNNGSTAKVAHSLRNSLEDERDNQKNLARRLREKNKEIEDGKEKLKQLEQGNNVLKELLQQETDRSSHGKNELKERLEEAEKQIGMLKERVRELEKGKLKTCKAEQQQ